MDEFVISTDLAAIENTQILANFEEVRAAVAELSRPYQGLVVTADSMKNAAADRAKLRKLRDRLDAQRKTVKAACLAPAEAFAKGLAPALAEIDKAVENIDRQIKELEEATRADKMQQIEAFFESALTPEIEGYVTFDRLRTMHPKWNNKGCGLTEAQNDIQADLANIRRGITALRGYPEQYRAALLDAFSARYDLGDVVAKYARMKEVEAYESQRSEIHTAQEAIRKAQAERQTGGAAATHTEPENAPEGSESGESAVSETPRAYDFRVWATREQITALRSFLLENGIRYGKVPKEG